MNDDNLGDLAIQIKLKTLGFAKDIIVQDLGMLGKGNLFTCPWHNHNDSHPSAEWRSEHFCCYSGDHSDSYDIITHYQEFYGLSFPEAIKTLCKENNINFVNHAIPPSYLSNKIKVTRSDDFIVNTRKVTYKATTEDKYLEGKNISKEIAVKKYGTTFSDTEIFFRHAEEVYDGLTNTRSWQNVFTKRRLLSGKDYEFDGASGKELSVAGGWGCFYGLNTLKDKPSAIICEGHTDALRVATDLAGCSGAVAVLSVPNGAASLKHAYEHSPTFRKWYSKHCKSLTFLPDADAAGKQLIEEAKRIFDSSNTFYVDISEEYPEFPYNATKGYDISDVLDSGIDIHDVIKYKTRPIPIDNCISARDIEIETISDGISSGFLTHDYNDAGLKNHKVTIMTGKRGEGKTTVARQMIVAAAMQGRKSWSLFSESSTGVEKSRFARMLNPNMITSRINNFNKRVYSPTPESVEKFDREYGKYMQFYEKKDKEGKLQIDYHFPDIMANMVTAAKQGTFLFVIDSLMSIVDSKTQVNMQQADIMKQLSKFKLDYKVHIILIAHPKKGDIVISGASEIENMADTILRYQRVKKASTLEKGTDCLKGEYLNSISAVVNNEKVRDEGSQHRIYCEWDPELGIVREVTDIKDLHVQAEQYRKQGYWTRPAEYSDIVEDEDLMPQSGGKSWEENVSNKGNK